MRELTFLGPRRLEWREVPAPALEGPVQALVRPIAAITCDLDRWLIAGGATPLPGPFPLGHEFVAEVVEVAHGGRSPRRPPRRGGPRGPATAAGGALRHHRGRQRRPRRAPLRAALHRARTLVLER
jgi:hypothetical protein